MGLAQIPEYAIFHTMRNFTLSGNSGSSARPSMRELHDQALEQIRVMLPPSWNIKAEWEPQVPGPVEPDAVWSLSGPDGQQTTLLVEVKSRSIEPREVHLMSQKLGVMRSRLRSLIPTSASILISTYLSPRAREMLDASGTSYIDATGNVRLQSAVPALFISTGGATKDPWRENRPILSLKGPAAARVVRALADFRPPYRAREVAERSHTPASSVSRILDFLDREALLMREPRGAVTEVKVADLIRRWTKDYDLTRTNHVTSLLEPRGIDALLRKLRNTELSYAATASLGAAAVAPYAATRLAVLYVPSVTQPAATLGLRNVETGANVLLVEPFDSVVFERTRLADGLCVAAISQVAADLLTSPGRGPAEGEELLRWMEDHEDSWRR